MASLETGTLYLEPDRNLALELVRATEAAAIRAVPFIGRGDKIAADRALRHRRIRRSEDAW